MAPGEREDIEGDAYVFVDDAYALFDELHRPRRADAPAGVAGADLRHGRLRGRDPGGSSHLLRLTRLSRGAAGSLRRMDRPPPDPAKLLADWMEWEKGETPPGKVISNLKTHGLRDLLESLRAAQGAGASA